METKKGLLFDVDQYYQGAYLYKTDLLMKILTSVEESDFLLTTLSILKWWKVVFLYTKNITVNETGGTCALCYIHSDDTNFCGTCPIAQFVDDKQCVATPYYTVIDLKSAIKELLFLHRVLLFVIFGR